MRRLFADPPTVPAPQPQELGWDRVDRLLGEASPDSVGLIGPVARQHGLMVGPALDNVVRAAAALGAPGEAQQKEFEKLVRAGREEIRASLPRPGGAASPRKFTLDS